MHGIRGIIDKAETILVEFRDANVTEQWVDHPLPSKWDAYPCEFFKVNFDASWSVETKKVGIGLVVQDYRGEFYAGMSKLGNIVASAETVELVAAREALNFALDAGFRDIILEGNNLSIINVYSG